MRERFFSLFRFSQLGGKKKTKTESHPPRDVQDVVSETKKQHKGDGRQRRVVVDQPGIGGRRGERNRFGLAAEEEAGGRRRRRRGRGRGGQEGDAARGVEVLEKGQADEEDGAHREPCGLRDLAEASGRA